MSHYKIAIYALTTSMIQFKHPCSDAPGTYGWRYGLLTPFNKRAAAFNWPAYLTGSTVSRIHTGVAHAIACWALSASLIVVISKRTYFETGVSLYQHVSIGETFDAYEVRENFIIGAEFAVSWVVPAISAVPKVQIHSKSSGRAILDAKYLIANLKGVLTVDGWYIGDVGDEPSLKSIHRLVHLLLVSTW